MAGTRSNKNKGIKHLLTMNHLTQDAIDYVLAGFEDPDNLVVMNNYGAIDQVYDDETKLPMIKRLIVKEVAAFLEQYYMNNKTYEGINTINDEQ